VFLSDIMRGFNDWSKAKNPFFAGELSDLLSLVPFLIITILLYFVGNELLFAKRRT
jgi:hypothetical protein